MYIIIMCTVLCVCMCMCMYVSIYHRVAIGRLYKDVYKENLSLSLLLCSHTLSPLLFFFYLKHFII